MLQVLEAVQTRRNTLYRVGKEAATSTEIARCKECGRPLRNGACLPCLEEALEEYTAEELREALQEIKDRQRKEVN